MQENITFLMPNDPANTISKSYTKGEDGRITKTSSYNIGTFFKVKIEPCSGLRDFHDLIRRYREHFFRIYGQPVEGLSTPTRRLNENFPDNPAGYHIHCIDIDGWPVPKAAAQAVGWSVQDSVSTEKLIRALLLQAGLTFMADSDLLVLLSASQFESLDTIRAHVYFEFEEPVTLTEMRAVALAANTGQAVKVFDPQVYRSVQPDFIGPPCCENFQDPIENRLFYCESPYGLTRVSRADWRAYKEIVEHNTGREIDTTVAAPKLGKNWIETLELHAGTEALGINEPCFRAAAQLITDEGHDRVQADLEGYTETLYNTAWRVIDARGIRGGVEDRRTYDIQKFRSYLKSALDKGFGTADEQRARVINKAIDAAMKGDYTALFSTYTLHQAALLKAGSFGLYTNVRSRIASELRKSVKISEWDTKVKKAAFQSIGDDPAQSLLPETEGAVPKNKIILSPTAGDSKAQIENQLAMEMSKEFDLLTDQDGAVHLGRQIAHNGDPARYLITSLSSDITNALYYRAMVLTDGAVSADFGKRCMQFLLGASKPGMEDIQRVRCRNVVIGDRVSQEGADTEAAVWWNLGDSHPLQSGAQTGAGQSQPEAPAAIRISKDGIERVPHLDGPVTWRQGFATMQVMDDKEMVSRFKDTEDLLRYFVQRARYFFSIDEDSVPMLAAWCVTALTNRPIPYMMELVGPKQSGKSTAATLLKDLIDPVNAPLEDGRGLTRFKKPDADFMNLLYSQRVTILDNLWELKPDSQDALCQVVTGLQFNERILYTQTRRNFFIKRPVIVTGLDEIVTREDLRSRVMSIPVRPIDKTDLYFFDNWRKEVHILRRALAELVRKVLIGYHGLRTSQNTSALKPRDIVYCLTKEALTPVEGVELVDIGRRLSDQRTVDNVFGDSRISTFLAFLQDKKSGFQPGHSYTMTGLLAHLKVWSRSNFGNVKDIHLVSPEGRSLGDAQVLVEAALSNTTAIGLGRFISQNLETLNNVSGFYVSQKHSRGIGKSNRSFTPYEAVDSEYYEKKQEKEDLENILTGLI